MVFPLLEMNYGSNNGTGNLKDDNKYNTDNDSAIQREEPNNNNALTMSQNSEFSLIGYSQFSNTNIAYNSIYNEGNFESTTSNRLSEMGYGLEGNKY